MARGGRYDIILRGGGDILTAKLYNEDHQRHVENAYPEQFDDFSDNLDMFRTIFNPYEGNVPQLPVSLAQEIAALRYMISRITGEGDWYLPPASNLKTGGGGGRIRYAIVSYSTAVDLMAGFAVLPNWDEEEIDIGDWFDTRASDRFTIPSGIHRVRLHAFVSVTGVETGVGATFSVRHGKVGVDGLTTVVASQGVEIEGTTVFTLSTPVVEVAETDYFQLWGSLTAAVADGTDPEISIDTKFSIFEFRSSEGEIPAGGTEGQALVKKSDDDFDLEWITIVGLPPGGTKGQVPAKKSGDDYDVEWVDAAEGGGNGGGNVGGGGSTPKYAVVSYNQTHTIAWPNGQPDWDEKEVDEGGWFDTLTPNRFTVPAGISRVRAHAIVQGTMGTQGRIQSSGGATGAPNVVSTIVGELHHRRPSMLAALSTAVGQSFLPYGNCYFTISTEPLEVEEGDFFTLSFSITGTESIEDPDAVQADIWAGTTFSIWEFTGPGAGSAGGGEGGGASAFSELTGQIAAAQIPDTVLVNRMFTDDQIDKEKFTTAVRASLAKADAALASADAVMLVNALPAVIPDANTVLILRDPVDENDEGIYVVKEATGDYYEGYVRPSLDSVIALQAFLDHNPNGSVGEIEWTVNGLHLYMEFASDAFSGTPPANLYLEAINVDADGDTIDASNLLSNTDKTNSRVVLVRQAVYDRGGHYSYGNQLSGATLVFWGGVDDGARIRFKVYTDSGYSTELVSAAGKYYDLITDNKFPHQFVLSRLEQAGATDGQVMTWSDSANKWGPGTVTSSGTSTVPTVLAGTRLPTSDDGKDGDFWVAGLDNGRTLSIAENVEGAWVEIGRATDRDDTMEILQQLTRDIQIGKLITEWSNVADSDADLFWTVPINNAITLTDANFNNKGASITIPASTSPRTNYLFVRLPAASDHSHLRLVQGSNLSYSGTWALADDEGVTIPTGDTYQYWMAVINLQETAQETWQLQERKAIEPTIFQGELGGNALATARNDGRFEALEHLTRDLHVNQPVPEWSDAADSEGDIYQVIDPGSAVTLTDANFNNNGATVQIPDGQNADTLIYVRLPVAADHTLYRITFDDREPRAGHTWHKVNGPDTSTYQYWYVYSVNNFGFSFVQLEKHTKVENTTYTGDGAVPVGGTTGQALTKKSGDDYDTEWTTVSGGSSSSTPLTADSILDVAQSSRDDTDRNKALTTDAGSNGQNSLVLKPVALLGSDGIVFPSQLGQGSYHVLSNPNVNTSRIILHQNGYHSLAYKEAGGAHAVATDALKRLNALATPTKLVRTFRDAVQADQYAHFGLRVIDQSQFPTGNPVHERFFYRQRADILGEANVYLFASVPKGFNSDDIRIKLIDDEGNLSDVLYPSGNQAWTAVNQANFQGNTVAARTATMASQLGPWADYYVLDARITYAANYDFFVLEIADREYTYPSPSSSDTTARAAAAAAQATADAALPLAGGTLTGALTLSGAPTEALQAATKAYVDANAGSGGSSGGGGGAAARTIVNAQSITAGTWTELSLEETPSDDDLVFFAFTNANSKGNSAPIRWGDIPESDSTGVPSSANVMSISYLVLSPSGANTIISQNTTELRKRTDGTFDLRNQRSTTMSAYAFGTGGSAAANTDPSPFELELIGESSMIALDADTVADTGLDMPASVASGEVWAIKIGNERYDDLSFFFPSEITGGNGAEIGDTLDPNTNAGDNAGATIRAKRGNSTQSDTILLAQDSTGNIVISSSHSNLDPIVTLYRVRGGSGSQLSDRDDLPPVDNYSVNDLVAVEDNFYKLAVTDASVANLFTGEVGRDVFNNTAGERWRGISNSQSPNGFSTDGEFTANPSNTLSMLLASSQRHIRVAMKRSVYEAAKGSAFNTRDHIAIRVTMADGTTTDEAVLAYYNLYERTEHYIIWQHRHETDNYNLYNEDAGNAIKIEFFTTRGSTPAATRTPLFTHDAAMKHWIHWPTGEDPTEDGRTALSLAQANSARIDALDMHVDGISEPIHSQTYDENTALRAPTAGNAGDFAVSQVFNNILTDDLIVIDWKKCEHLNHHDEYVVPGSDTDSGRMYLHPRNFDNTEWNGEFVYAVDRAIQNNGSADTLNSWIVGSILYSGSTLTFGLHLQQGGSRANRNLKPQAGFSLTLRIYRNTIRALPTSSPFKGIELGRLVGHNSNRLGEQSWTNLATDVTTVDGPGSGWSHWLSIPMHNFITLDGGLGLILEMTRTGVTGQFSQIFIPWHMMGNWGSDANGPQLFGGLWQPSGTANNDRIEVRGRINNGRLDIQAACASADTTGTLHAYIAR